MMRDFWKAAALLFAIGAVTTTLGNGYVVAAGIALGLSFLYGLMQAVRIALSADPDDDLTNLLFAVGVAAVSAVALAALVEGVV